MKICFFGTYDPLFSQNKILMDGLRAAGHEVVEVAVPTPLTNINAQSHVGVKAVLSRLLHKCRIIPVALSKLSVIRSSDAVYVGYPGHFDVPLAWIFAKLAGKKLIFFPVINLFTVFTTNVDLFTSDSLKARLILMFEKIIYRLPDYLFADTPFQKKYMCEEFHLDEKKVSVLPIGADDTIYPYSGIQTDGQKVTVTYYGTFNPLHGVTYLVEAANILKNATNIHFVLVGKGPTWQDDYDKAQKYGLTNCEFVGSVNEKDANQYLRSADIFIGFLKDAPAVRQSIANKIFQGLAMGKAVVTVDTEVARSMFTDRENMYFIEANNAQSLADAIRNLATDQDLLQKIGKNGYTRFTDDFTPKKLAQTLVRTIH